MSTNKVAFLFPGQGSQYVGMGQEFLESGSKAKELMSMAESVSGIPLSELCLQGPMSELTRTLHLQPAVTVINMICLQAALDAGLKADFVAGHSLGEYSALYAAKVLSAEDTLKLVTERGRLMEREAYANPGGMHAILGLSLDTVRSLVDGNGNGKVTAANYNTEQQIVISGDKEALNDVAEVAKVQGGRAIPLKVSGAWHSSLVAGAVPDFVRAMEPITFEHPQISILFNVTGEEETKPAEIKTIMAQQIASMVNWVDIIKNLLDQGVTSFIEIGPKNVLTGLLKKILPAEPKCTCLQFDTPDNLEKVLVELGTE